MRRRLLALVIGAIAILLPAAAQAQSGIAGVVRDTSGAVLPGVRVEASSPALIEQTRSVVTDDAGQYKVVDLRPGVYTVTFSKGSARSGERASSSRRTSQSAVPTAPVTVATVAAAMRADAVTTIEYSGSGYSFGCTSSSTTVTTRTC
jgi:hypothetical protein